MIDRNQLDRDQKFGFSSKSCFYNFDIDNKEDNGKNSVYSKKKRYSFSIDQAHSNFSWSPQSKKYSSGQHNNLRAINLNPNVNPDLPDKISCFEPKDYGLEKITSESQTNRILNNPIHSREIFKFLRFRELIKQPKKEYISFNHRNINQIMRCKIIDWMVAVAEQFRLRNETLLLSIGYVDRFLSNIHNKDFGCSKLQLIAIASILIASKIEEILPPHIEDLLFITGYGYKRVDIMVMEWQVLDSLAYETTQPTTLTFLSRILKAYVGSVREKEDIVMHVFCSYLAELAIFDYKVTTSFLPSLIASSCVLLANFILFIYKPIWTTELRRLSGNYKSTQLENCCVLIYKSLSKTMKNLEHPSSICTKYFNSRIWKVYIYKDVVRSFQMFDSLPSPIFANN